MYTIKLLKKLTRKAEDNNFSLTFRKRTKGYMTGSTYFALSSGQV